MPAKGSSNCFICPPCHNTASCSDNAAIRCVPKYLCATIAITPGEELCCPSNEVSGLLFYNSGVGDCGYWGGGNTCGRVRFSFEITMTENDSPDATLECRFLIWYDSDTVATIDETFQITILDGGGISFTSGPYSDGTNAFTVTIGAASVIEHPWNKRTCNPCVCVRCLPASFCVRMVKRAKDMTSANRCKGCYTTFYAEYDESACGWFGSATCALDIYNVTISFPPIYDGNCALKVEATGAGMSGEVIMVLEGASGSIAPTGCLKCCYRNTLVGRYGVDCPPCFDCLAESPEEDFGCGATLIQDAEAGLVIENDDFDVTFEIEAVWCLEKCESSETECGCCPELEYQEDVFCPEAERVSLFATIDAPGCDYDGMIVELIPRTAFNPAPPGSPALNGKCGDYASDYFTLTCDEASEVGNTVTGYLAVRCVRPVPDICGVAISDSRYYKLFYQFTSACLGPGVSGNVDPDEHACSPPDFTYTVPNVMNSGIQPVTCDCCDAAGSFTIHVSE